MISIITPTFNEEKYLPKLLSSIKKQTYKNYEIIVADANSTDATREIAKKFRCKIVKGGKHATGVNNGAKAAKGDVLLLIDADAVMPDEFLNKNFKEFREKNLDVASCYIKPIKGNIIDKIMHWIANLYYFSFKRIRPFVASFCIFVKKDFFFKVGCFNEKIPWLVDLAFSNSLPRNTRYDILPIPINLSVRMAERLGRLGQARLMFLAAVLRTINKNYYGEYNWNNKSTGRTI